MPHRIALASSNGKVIDQHFAQARNFQIVDLFEDRYLLVETRNIQPVPGGKGHSTGVWENIAGLLADCEGVFVSRIGYGAAAYLNSIGLRVFEAPYPLESVLKKLLAGKILETEKESNE
ncbi:NifB/NifX family molybdenum-iron cluster-binding protein [Bacillota bacterium LX-D]|nr:NifB/NifX family molybdenum-iron cluster-binding protein [Bacillota bacterium LX-D]